jgi:hypothetical protein
MAEMKKLGDMLKEAGLIDDFQLQSALSHQRNWGGKLGNILVELEFVREEDIARVVSEKLKIPYVNLFEPPVPETVVKLLKADIAKKYHVMPAAKDKGSLVLAMSDPLDIEAMDEIRFITGLSIRPALAMKSEIKDAIGKYYDGENINRDASKSLFHLKSHTEGGKMEIIRGSELNMPKSAERDATSPLLSREEVTARSVEDSKIRLDALTSLLIEKGIITRDELVSMIYQKKIGL